MKSIYTTLAEFGGNEKNGTSFQTRPFQVDDAPVLARAICYLNENHLCLDHYEFKHWRGSLTLQRDGDHREVVKVFFDDQAKLSPSNGRSLVFGFELTGKRKQDAEGTRMRLAGVFGQGYIDPRVKGFTKYSLNPNPYEHYYDLAVAEGIKEYEVEDQDLFSHLEGKIRDAITQDQDGQVVSFPVNATFQIESFPPPASS